MHIQYSAHFLNSKIMSKNINYRGKGPYLNIDSCYKIRLAYYQWTFFVSLTKPMLIKYYFTSFH